MAFTDRGTSEAKKAQTHADCIASLARSRKEVIDERNETYKDVKLPDNIITPEDHINYVQSVVLGFGKKVAGKKGSQALEKKKCLNCGSTKILRQRDEEITDKVVWLDEYECLDCKERMVL